MGKIKRRMKYIFCPCGSMKPASECCLKNGKWQKCASELGLRNLSPLTAIDRCYMKELNSCKGPISGEHIISESVIKILKGEGEFTISGLPWLKPNEYKTLSPKNLITKCLCTRHNSAISPLDEAAKYFFLSLKTYFNTDTGEPRHALVSGHDLERWLLKTAQNLAISGNFAVNRIKLSGAFALDLSIVDMLDDPDNWPEGTGLYCIMNIGDKMENHDHFQLEPFLNEQNEIAAIWLSIMDLKFILLLVQPDESKYPFLINAIFRPGCISIRQPKSNNWVTMSWQDSLVHPVLEIRNTESNLRNENH